MPDYEVFPNSPVEEAIISFRLREAIDPDAGAEPLIATLRDRYPVVERFESSASLRPRGANSIRLLSPDRQQAVQVTPQAFSFHRLRPYTRWHGFAGAARVAWESFTSVFGPKAPDDVQLRFLNVFHLPLPFDDWGDFLVIYPNLPPPVNTGLTHFLMSLALEDAEVPATATVTQTAEPESDGSIPLILDIDTRSSTSTVHLDDDALWRTLDALRAYKNRLFFEGLTDQAKELFR